MGIRGIDVTLYVRTKLGTDDFGAPVYAEQAETVSNVLIGEPTTEAVTAELQLYGRHLAYTLSLPKGDTHNWENARVSFFGQTFRTYGNVTEGIESLLPLSWNRKVKVERYE